ncbi:hypothetical protein PI125_g3071 [Phytophthora idaei]|nr:hypothetical protein PI125_g3071 [Phytophthora idaei]
MTHSSLPSLPLSIVSVVMEFAVYGYSQDLFPSKRSHPRKHLKDVAMVSKSWLQPVQQLMTQYEQETMETQLKTGAKEEILGIRSETAARCGAVRDLRVVIGTEPKYSYGVQKFMVLTKKTEAVQVDWDALLAQMPGLRRLDLKLVPLLSKHLPELLKAAGKYCYHLESLVLPRKAELKEVAKGDKIETVLKELYGVRCEDKWMVSLDTWEEFNKTCTNLREFHWASVPFADPFFQVFGANPKPHLQTLGVTANLLWSWKEYLQKHTDSAARHFKIESFGDEFWVSVATNCPRLERFAIRNCANFEVMNVRPIRTFTDASLLGLAELKDLYSVESNAAVMCTGDGIFDYMHRVLELNCYSNSWRMLDLRIGGQQNGFFGVPMFYSVVVGLLRRLAEISEKDLGAGACKQKFEVFLSNPYHSRVSKQWSSIYMRDELRPLMYRVKEMHPSLSLNASINGVSGDTFSKIDMFTLSWRPRDRERDMFWNSAEDEYNSENDPSDHMPPALMNLFNELLGYNSQGGGSASSGDDVEENEEDNFWGL